MKKIELSQWMLDDICLSTGLIRIGDQERLIEVLERVLPNYFVPKLKPKKQPKK